MREASPLERMSPAAIPLFQPPVSQGRRRAVVALLLTLLVSVSCSSNTGTVSLFNKAEEPISRATLTMSWGDTFDVINLDPSESATINYRVREGEYRVEVDCSIWKTS